ncbi:YvcK family protein [Candidatus Chloroploca sp. M-50]|uniref:YvcK family protein n=1 Tax=Candidatus Chloroploca mongolica TaxID=2528176 RepID=A0ABS4D896_9CHLR|nr:2-phospho-L-lactate transferase CofD family protein [Candidatus Chloroploca mongolica]MBP1465661.1 YvcK family protein [Candidatus Chloroploca mongolica]
MRNIIRRFASLGYLTAPLALTFVGVVLLSLGVAYLFIHLYRSLEDLPTFFSILTLQFMPRPWRAVLLSGAGIAVLAFGLWQLSGVMIIPLRQGETDGSDDVVLGYRRDAPPKLVVLSGGPGMLILSAMGEQVRQLTCIVPVQDPVEYYYRASGLFATQNVYYVVPTPEPIQVMAQLDDGTSIDVRHLSLNQQIAPRHVVDLHLARNPTSESIQVTRLALEAIREADAIILGPGSLFESIVPNLLIDDLREAIVRSKARKIYVCNLMTEPGRTTGFSVADHIRTIKTFGNFTPDVVLVNAQRIDPEVYRLYAAALQSPVVLSPEEYEETALVTGTNGGPAGLRGVMIEGSLVIEADLASSVIQYTASLNNPAEQRAVRVLRHDNQKLSRAILALLRRG